jgi:hypothetical protein
MLVSPLSVAPDLDPEVTPTTPRGRDPGRSSASPALASAEASATDHLYQEAAKLDNEQRIAVLRSVASGDLTMDEAIGLVRQFLAALAGNFEEAGEEAGKQLERRDSAEADLPSDAYDSDSDLDEEGTSEAEGGSPLQVAPEANRPPLPPPQDRTEDVIGTHASTVGSSSASEASSASWVAFGSEREGSATVHPAP